MAKVQPASSQDEIRSLLRGFPPVVGAVAEELMALIARTSPDLVGVVRNGWGSVNYRHRSAGYVCGVFPMRDQVLLVFENGCELSHPLLEGDTKRVRWIRFYPGAALPEDDVAILIAEAIALRA